MEKTAAILIPLCVVCLLVTLLCIFASNRVIIRASPTLPPLSAFDNLQCSRKSSDRFLKNVSFEKTTNGKKFTVRVTAKGLSFGEVIPASSAELKMETEDYVKFFQAWLPASNYQISEAKEHLVNGKPGYIYLMTSRKSGDESYAKELRYVSNGSRFFISSKVSAKGNKLTAHDKKEADHLFAKYLAELQTGAK